MSGDDKVMAILATSVATIVGLFATPWALAFGGIAVAVIAFAPGEKP